MEELSNRTLLTVLWTRRMWNSSDGNVCREMNAGKCENAVLLVSTFVHNRAGFQKDGTADNEIGNGWGCYDLGLQNENLILKAEELGYELLLWGSGMRIRSENFVLFRRRRRVVGVIAVRSSGGRAWTAEKERYRRDSEVFVRSS